MDRCRCDRRRGGNPDVTAAVFCDGMHQHSSTHPVQSRRARLGAGRLTAATVALCLLAACGGSENSDSSDTTGANTASSGPAASDPPAASDTTGSPTTDPEATGPAGPDTTAANSQNTAAVDRLVVGGQAIDACGALTAIAESIAGSSNGVQIRMPDDLAAALGQDQIPGFGYEGSLLCTYEVADSMTGQTDIIVASDEMLQFSLQDPAMTAASRGAQRRAASEADASISGFGNTIVDLPGVGDQAWFNWLSGGFTAIRGNLMVTLVSEEAMMTCALSPDQPDPCQQPILDKYSAALIAALDALDAAAAEGGEAFTFPTVMPTDTLMVPAAGGERDLCAALAAAAPTIQPGIRLDPPQAGSTYCQITPVDSDLEHARLSVNTETGADALLSASFADAMSNDPSAQTIDDLGVPAFLDQFGQVVVQMPGVLLTISVESPDAFGSSYDGGKSLDTARSLVQALQS